MRPVRAEGRAGAGLSRATGEATASQNTGASFRLGIELDAVSDYYAAKIAAVKGGPSPRDIGGAVRAIRDEQAGAVRAVLERWHTARSVTAKRQAPKTPTESRAPVRPVGGREPT